MDFAEPNIPELKRNLNWKEKKFLKSVQSLIKLRHILGHFHSLGFSLANCQPSNAVNDSPDPDPDSQFLIPPPTGWALECPFLRVLYLLLAWP